MCECEFFVFKIVLPSYLEKGKTNELFSANKHKLLGIDTKD